MSAKSTLKCNKIAIQQALCGDYKLILNKVCERELITGREYNNLKSINKEDVEGHVIELMDKIMNKGEDTCQAFLDLLQTDEDVKETYPELKKIKLKDTCLLPKPVQASSDDLPQESQMGAKDTYQLNSRPTGLCVIVNNEIFTHSKPRPGTNKDAESLAKVFSWLGFRVLMCKDQTGDQMDRALKCFASLSDLSQLQEFSVQEWCDSGFTDLQEAPKHGDAFVCCILSHGKKGEVSGIDGESLSIKQITKSFKATDQSALTSKPKVFLIQACQAKPGEPGGPGQRGVMEKDLQSDDCSPLTIPEEADVLVGMATVEDYPAFRHPKDGSWFIESVCKQLRSGCPRGDDLYTILTRVNREVAQKEATSKPGEGKQLPEFRSTLCHRLVLSPHHD
ncbi:caspase-8-like [Pempheris klunzingeri]|uniref:caspase-8-like n=1 Tax=Pempheris klunzingeri TaxID=3127111 RepID=UPI003980B114